MVAKANKLDLDIVETVPANGVSQDYLKINHLGRIPSFVGADGYTLTESMAIAIYSSLTPLCAVTYTIQMMKDSIKYSYPCLKTTVETDSHSDFLLILLLLHLR